MKRMLLVLAVQTAALTAAAQLWDGEAKWTGAVTPVSTADQLSQTHVALAADGTTYTTGTFDQPFSFGGVTLPNEDAMTSAYIAQYGADGTEKAAVSLYGAAVIRDITVDAEGNVYVTGSFADEVVVGSADGVSQTITGMEEETNLVSAFVAKYDAALNLKAVRSLVPAMDMEVAAAAMEQEIMYFPASGDIFVTPNRIQVDGGKVYVSASWAGNLDLDDVAWRGSYLDVWGFMYMDIASVGILSMSADDLSGAASVASLQMKENFSGVQQNPESVNFTVADGVVYAAFVGKGTETLTTASGTTDFEMGTTDDDSGNTEHAFILATIGEETASKVFHVEMHAQSYQTDRVARVLFDGENIILGGTYYGQLGFDTELSSTGSADMFAASVNPADFSVNWAVTDSYDEGDTSIFEEAATDLAMADGKLFLVGVARDKATRETRQAITWNIAEGAITAGDNVEYAAIAARDGLVAAIVNNGATTTVSFYGGTEEPKPYDLNQDGSVDVSDVTLLVAAILADEEAPEAFDLNQDGSVDVSDVTELVNYILSDEEEAAEDPAPVEP